jgi:DNA-binding NarL/FixJ family response regulator
MGMAGGPSPVDHWGVGDAAPIRVLLCDDAEGFRALMRSSLADDPCIEVVGEAADGEAGVQATADLQPDVVLLDMSMPRMGGLQAIPKMRRTAPRTSIIGLSSFSAARMRGPSIEIGAHSYLEKGTELDEIRQAIHGAAEQARNSA